MDKLFEMLARGEMPDFSQMLSALNDISDVDWDALERSSLSITDVFRDHRVPEHPVFCSGQFCESCG